MSDALEPAVSTPIAAAQTLILAPNGDRGSRLHRPPRISLQPAAALVERPLLLRAPTTTRRTGDPDIHLRAFDSSLADVERRSWGSTGPFPRTGGREHGARISRCPRRSPRTRERRALHRLAGRERSERGADRGADVRSLGRRGLRAGDGERAQHRRVERERARRGDGPGLDRRVGRHHADQDARHLHQRHTERRRDPGERRQPHRDAGSPRRRRARRRARGDHVGRSRDGARGRRVRAALRREPRRRSPTIRRPAINDVVTAGDQITPTIAGSSAAGGRSSPHGSTHRPGDVRARVLGGTNGFLFNPIDGQATEFKASLAANVNRANPMVAVGGAGSLGRHRLGRRRVDLRAPISDLDGITTKQTSVATEQESARTSCETKRCPGGARRRTSCALTTPDAGSAQGSRGPL